MNISPLGNKLTTNNKDYKQDKDELICIRLYQETQNGKPASELLKIIDERINELSTSKAKQIDFLEKAFGSCDFIKPFGAQPQNIREALSGIKDRIKELRPIYFSETKKAFEKSKTNEKKNINLARNTSDNSIAGSIISFFTGTKYIIQKTSGELNNCLIHAVSKGNPGTLYRRILFTTNKVEEYLKRSYNKFKTEFKTDDENFLEFRQAIISIYNDAENLLKPAASISELAERLSNHIITSGCYLDSQIAAPILAKELKTNIVIITPEQKNESGFTFKVIDCNADLIINGELSKQDLRNLEAQPNTIFILNRAGKHFEWIKQVGSKIRIRG